MFNLLLQVQLFNQYSSGHIHLCIRRIIGSGYTLSPYMGKLLSILHAYQLLLGLNGFFNVQNNKLLTINNSIKIMKDHLVMFTKMVYLWMCQGDFQLACIKYAGIIGSGELCQ